MKKIVLKILGIITIVIFLLQVNMVVIAANLNDVNKKIEEKEPACV